MMRSSLKHFAMVLLSSLLVGCMVGPDFRVPEADLPQGWQDADGEAVLPTAPDHAEWWRAFSDPSLTALVEEASRNNLGLQIAGLRVFEARALLGRVRSSLYPQIQNAMVGGGSIKLSENSELFSILPDAVADATDDSYESYGIGMDAAWELDLWGRFRRSIQGAEANLEGTIATRADILVTLQGEVATAYVLLRTLQEQHANARANVELQQRSLEIAEVRNRNGLTTELDVQQSLALLRDTQSLLPKLTTAIRRTKNVLSLLIGRPPSELVDLVADEGAIPTAPNSIAVGVPSELLRRRPDVRGAEMLAASQSALIGATKADLYPAFRLTGTVGYAAESTGDLFKSDSFASIGTFGFMWKFLNYGRLQNRVRAQDARFQQAVTGYQLTVLAAAREVDDALAGYLGAREEVALKRDSVTAAERAVEIALSQYRDGITSYTTVLDTQRIQLLQQDALARTRGRVAANLIAAYKALGGGWAPESAIEFVPQAIRAEMQERTGWGDLLDTN